MTLLVSFSMTVPLCSDSWLINGYGVSLKHDGTDGSVKLVNTDGTAIERADGTANTGVN